MSGKENDFRSSCTRRRGFANIFLSENMKSTPSLRTFVEEAFFFTLPFSSRNDVISDTKSSLLPTHKFPRIVPGHNHWLASGWFDLVSWMFGWIFDGSVQQSSIQHTAAENMCGKKSHRTPNRRALALTHGS